MNRNKEPLVSLCERKFILEAIKEGKRVDGREVYDYRNVSICIVKEPGRVEVTLGKTRVLACVTCQVIQPKPQRPTEGVLFFNVELSPMASPSFEIGKQSSLSVEVTRILERCQKESRAVDTESLCIIAGQKVWEIRIDLHVLDHCGNIIDCAAIAAISALKHCRRPDVTVVGEEATVHPVSERDPVPLSVHHMPICFTFAFFLDGEYMLVDPSLEEEQVMEGKLVVGMNVHKEICVLQMIGGVAILPEQVMRCTQIAAVKCVEIIEMIKRAISGKTVDTFEGVESILQSNRQPEEVEFESSPMMEEEEEEPMQEEPQGQVNYLGPGTAELVGLGGESTWEVLDSIENCSDSDMACDTEPIALPPQKAKPKSRSQSTEPKKKAVRDTKGRDSGSEEEETVQLTDPDLTGTTGAGTRDQSVSGDGGIENGNRETGNKKKRTSDVKVSDVKAAKNKKGRKRGKGGGAALAGESAAMGKSKKAQNK